ncbi:MAG: hypothetical protein HY958_08985 [Bacteroidia bacterium]|nr:hypothetical protein [Bacteroidia bacterium]
MEPVNFEKETLKVINPNGKTLPGMKFNSFLLGAVFGMLVPSLAFVIFYLVKAPRNFTFIDFIKQVKYFEMLSSLISLCVIPNLLIFFIFIWLNKLYSARGMVFATMVYAFIIVIVKFLL